MNLNARRKNIFVANKDDDEEKEEQMDDEEEYEDNTDNEGIKEEEKDEEMDEECEDDEPDFMDDSGKCWQFAIKIVDEKHLKEWCHKMGEIILGKEEKLTRQFHCQIKECHFRVIFLKSCSNVYTRNEHNHNHRMENAKNIQNKEEKTNEPDYVNQYGKLWPFRAHLGNNISKQMFNKFGFNDIHKSKKSLFLYCGKRNSSGGRCIFAGIYLKSNGCLYTLGEHEHSERGKIPQNIGDNYIDHFGKLWKFNKQIGKNFQNEMLRNEFGFSAIHQRQTSVNLYCLKKMTNGERCPIKGIYVKENGCLYIRGKHEHK